MKGIDISSWQRGLYLPAAGVDFAILKISEGRTWADPCFDGFYNDALGAGIPMGAYVYSYATTTAAAVEEARHALELLRGRKLPLGLYIDVEDEKQLAISDSSLTAVVKAFCDTVRAAGYRPGAYGSLGNLWAKVGPSYLGFDVLVWAAAWSNSAPKIGDIWQYTDNETVSGYNGPVDGDKALSDRFVELIRGGGTPTIDPAPEPAEDTPTTPFWPPRVVCFGMVGSDVAVLQALLTAHGHAAEATGIFDNKTKSAALSFQAENGLDADGIAGPKTFRALGVNV